MLHRDEWIQFLGVKAEKAKLPPVRWITIWDEEQNDFIDFFTNQLTWSPVTIADIYKERWQIESFFRALKQILKVKTFVGTPENAIGTQNWDSTHSNIDLKGSELWISNRDLPIQLGGDLPHPPLYL